MRLLTLKVALVMLASCADGFAQADFRFYVSDETKDENLHYEFVQDIAIYTFESQPPRIVYYTEYRINGVNQEKFDYSTESYAGDLTPADHAAFLDRVRGLPLEALESDLEDEDSRGTIGWIKLDEELHSVTATGEADARVAWREALEGFLSKHAPPGKREITRRSAEGDVVEPRAIEFQTLLKNPKKFDGKRVRLSGFYHNEFEGSSFAASEKEIENYDRALWLDGASTFADPGKVSDLNDVSLTVEGTFELGPGGHMGLWMGVLTRVTESRPTGAGRGEAVENAKTSNSGEEEGKHQASGEEKNPE